MALTGEGEPLRLDAALVTAEYFQVYGAATLMGRTFAPGDDQPGAEKSVVLSYSRLAKPVRRRSTDSRAPPAVRWRAAPGDRCAAAGGVRSRARPDLDAARAAAGGAGAGVPLARSYRAPSQGRDARSGNRGDGARLRGDGRRQGSADGRLDSRCPTARQNAGGREPAAIDAHRPSALSRWCC